MFKQLRFCLVPMLLLFGVMANADVTVDGLTYSLDETNLTATFTIANKNLNVQTLTIPATITNDGKTYKVTGFVNSAFQGGKFTSIVWETPTNITTIGDWVFAECNNLEEVELPEGITTLKSNRAFGKMAKLKKITLPSTLTSIQNYTFSADPLLNTIVFKGATPPSTISDGLFRETTVISNITIVVPDGSLTPYEGSNLSLYNLANSFSSDVTKNIVNNYLTQSAYNSNSYFSRGGIVTKADLANDKFVFIQAASCINNTPFFIKENESNTCKWAIGADQSCVWKLISTGEEFNKNGKTAPTYYIQNVATGNYMSVPKTGTMSASIEDAAKIAFYSTAEPPYSNAHYNAYTDGWIEASSSIIYDSSHDYFLRNDVGQQTTGSFGTNYDTHNWMWNVYEAKNVAYAEFCSEIAPYIIKNVVAGTDPGLATEATATAYNNALAVTNSISNTSTAEAMSAAKTNLITAYNNLVINPIVEGYYYIVSAGKGSGYPFSSEIKYDDENKFALYNADGKVQWKAFGEGSSDQIYYLTSDGKGNWFAKSYLDNTYINKGLSSYNCNVSTSETATTAQTFIPSADFGKFVCRASNATNAYALTSSHNGATTKTSSTLSIWGTVDQANQGKMNYWYLHSVPAEKVEGVKADASAALLELANEYKALNLKAEGKPGHITTSDALETFNSEIATAENIAAGGTMSEILAEMSTLREAYNTCVSNTNPIVNGTYYIVCDNAGIKANEKSDKAMYIDAEASTVNWGEKVDYNNKFAFEVTVNENGTLYIKNVATGLYTGASTAFCGAAPSSAEPVEVSTIVYPGTGSFVLKGGTWTYCPQGNPSGTSAGPNNVWAYNGEGTAGGNAPYKEWTWRFEPFVECEFTVVDNVLVGVGVLNNSSISEAITANPTATSVNLSGATLAEDVTAESLTSALTGNQIAFVSTESGISGTNIVAGNSCTSLVLTDKETFAPAYGFTATSATYGKTLADGGWYSCVLPYQFTIPEGVTVLNNAQISGNTITFDEVTGSVAANTPFLYKKADGGAITFEAANAAVNATVGTSGKLNGTYAKIPAGSATGKLILNSTGSAFAEASATASIPAFRAYIDGVAGSNIFTIVINDDVTGVASFDADGNVDNTPVDVYSVDGKLVRKSVNPVTALQGLESGIYIVNGKKIKK